MCHKRVFKAKVVWRGRSQLRRYSRPRDLCRRVYLSSSHRSPLEEAFVLHRACWRLRARDPWILHNQQWHTVTKLPSSLFHNHPICQHIHRSLFLLLDPKDLCIELISYGPFVVLCPFLELLIIYFIFTVDIKGSITNILWRKIGILWLWVND